MSEFSYSLSGKNILITGSARRLGKEIALYLAQAGANIIIHHGHSPELAEQTKNEIQHFGVRAWVVQADLEDPAQIQAVFAETKTFGEIYALINNAAIFSPKRVSKTDLPTWQSHLAINLTAPFLLCQGFAAQLPADHPGRILNILDWRALKPGQDHFAYTISKAGLAALTQSLALDLAPHIQVNGLALGAILPPSDHAMVTDILAQVPIKRWATLAEVGQAVLFLLAGPEYITGEIIHLDGGRHLN